MILLNASFGVGSILVMIDLGECKMTKNSARQQTNAVDPQPARPEKEKEVTEQRGLQDAFEDDEVYEALKSLRKRKSAVS